MTDAEPSAEPPATMPGRGRTWLVRGLQLAASLAVLWALASDVDFGRLATVLGEVSAAGLLGAFGLKTGGLLLHEIRLWHLLPAPRPPVAKVISVGFAAGVINLILPARAGDVAAILLLRRECRVPAATATAAVGLVSFLEAAVFGVILLGTLVLGAARWERAIGAEATGTAMQWVTVVTLGGIGAAVLVTVVGRRIAGRGHAPGGPGPLALVRDTLSRAGTSLSSPVSLALNLLMALLQVLLLVSAFAVCLPALGLEVPMPWLAAAGVMAISSLAAVVLPPTYGAGPAAASVAILAVFGVDQAGALAFAVCWWLVAQVPAVAIGVPALWGREIRSEG